MKNLFGYDPNNPAIIEPVELAPPVIMPFSKFAKGDYPDLDHNLYIVWRGKKALYIGISRGCIWDRWFDRNGRHIAIDGAGNWHAEYSSPIGRAIIRNRPASLRWKIELRQCDNLTKAELELIKELRPIFNATYRPALTDKEKHLYKKLLADEIERRTSGPAEDFIRYK